ncbi:hypothetical protein PM082_013109 [Marasmius tenuissimus]|nr:hypothetical protein PM082_013109 [Marasmius tenuissimus]
MAAVPSSSRTRAIPLISLFTRPPHPQTGKLCSGYLANATSILGSRFTPQSLPVRPFMCCPCGKPFDDAWGQLIISRTRVLPPAPSQSTKFPTRRSLAGAQRPFGPLPIPCAMHALYSARHLGLSLSLSGFHQNKLSLTLLRSNTRQSEDGESIAERGYV